MSVAVTSSRTFRVLRRLLASVLVILLLFAGSFAVGIWFDDSITFVGFEPDAADLLDEVIAKSGLPMDEMSDVETRDEDGTQPETAERSLRTSRTSSQIRQAIHRSCRMLRLTPPSASWARVEPDMVCEGNWRSRSVGIHVVNICKPQCVAFIEVRAL